MIVELRTAQAEQAKLLNGALQQITELAKATSAVVDALKGE